MSNVAFPFPNKIQKLRNPVSNDTRVVSNSLGNCKCAARMPHPHIRTCQLNAMESETPSKRRNWTKEINVDAPLASKLGALMDAWEEVVAKLSTCSAFTRTPFGVMKVQNRFLAPVNKHRKYNNRSAAASGAAEGYSKKLALLEDLLTLCEEHKKEKTEHAEWEKRNKDEDEAKGARVRRIAMTSLGKRETVEGDSAHMKDKYGSMIRMLAADTDKALAYKRDELEI
ncbi:hypothetical protein PybrP1_005755 [[Pythium] brassicae (nom. inval.)]|nr:hypothetical protein PybrP1_005755 [[Pythium] brassicae (nom. inval.)]